MNHKALKFNQISQIIREYCLFYDVTYNEDEIVEWTDDIVNIIYSIGGAPTEITLKKMLPEYFRIMNILK